MANNTNKKEISFIEVEEVLKKNKVRTRTLFTRKSRKLSDVLDDLAKKWHKFSKEDKSCLINKAVVSPSSVGFVAIITSLKFPFSILSLSSFSLKDPGPIPFIGFIAPPST